VRASPKPHADVDARYSHNDGRDKEPYRVAVNQLIRWSLGMRKCEEQCTDDEQEATASDEEPDLARQSAQVGSHKYESQLVHWSEALA
jgi:hypothetical protein